MKTEGLFLRECIEHSSFVLTEHQQPQNFAQVLLLKLKESDVIFRRDPNLLARARKGKIQAQSSNAFRI